MVSASTTGPVFHYGWGVTRPALILLIFTILRRESVGKQLLVLWKLFRSLSHTTKHGIQYKRCGRRKGVFFLIKLNILTLKNYLKISIVISNILKYRGKNRMEIQQLAQPGCNKIAFIKKKLPPKTFFSPFGDHFYTT